MDIENDPDVLLVRKHLVEHLGRPDEVFEVRGSPLPTSPLQALHLAYFAPGGPDAPVVYATCGACLFKMKDERRVEGLMLLRKTPDPEAISAIHRMLSSFAIFAEANNETVRVGDVVRAPENLHRFSHMDAVLFLPPVPFVESFHKVMIRDNQAVDVIWLLPVYESEAQYALKHGPQALMLLFAAQGLDLTQMDRDEANTMIEPDDARQMAQKRAEDERKKNDPRAPGQKRGPQRRQPPATPGSYEVQDDPNAVTVVRRGAKEKPKPKTDPVVSPPPPQPQVLQAPQAPQAHAAPAQPPKRHLEVVPPPQADDDARTPPSIQSQPQRQPLLAKPKKPALGLAPVKAEKVVKFDLNAPAGQAPAQGPGQRKPIISTQKPTASAPAAAPVKPKQPETPEQKAEAKKKKIEELKQKAQDAAKRAAERQAATRSNPDDEPQP